MISEYMKKIVLLVHQFLPEYYGGTEILTLNAAREFIKRGYEVTVFTGFPVNEHIEDKNRFGSYTYEGIDVKCFYYSREPIGSQKNNFEIEYNNLFFAGFFRSFLKTWKPDFVHIFHLLYLSASVLDVCKEVKIPVFYSATDFWMICPQCQLLLTDGSLCSGPDRNSLNCIRHMLYLSRMKKIKFIMKLIPDWILFLMLIAVRKVMFRALSERPEFFRKRMNYIDTVFVPTHFMGKMLVNNGLEQRRVQYLQFGIEKNKMPVNTSRGNLHILRIGYIGTLSWHKGVHILIKAVRMLASGIDADLKIYGSPDHFPGYYRHLQKLKRGDERISFCGTFPNEKIEKIFSGIDVLAVPSIWYENTPLILYTAQAAGCPVIATDLPGMSEAIENEVNGLLFKKGDAKSLGKAIIRLALERNLLLKMSGNSRQPKSIFEYVSEIEKKYNEINSLEKNPL